MATFRKRNGLWQVQVRLKGASPRSRSFTTKTEATRWARDTESAIDQGSGLGRNTKSDLRTLGDILKIYVAKVTPKKKGAASEVYRVRVLERHPIAAVRLSHLRVGHIAQYRDDRLDRVQSASVRRELVVLRHCLEVAIREWDAPISANPVSQIQMPSCARPRDRRLLLEEEKRLLDAVGDGRQSLMLPIVKLALQTAMRRGELLTLTWENVDTSRAIAFLTSTKNGLTREVPLARDALKTVEQIPKLDEKLFPLSSNAVRLAWVRGVRRSGLVDLRFHDLRHEAITRFFEAGLSAQEVALISGHRDPAMLARYTHLRADDVASKLGSIDLPRNNSGSLQNYSTREL